MKRRELLKTLSISLGVVVATPALMQILVSCEERKALAWNPIFLDSTQGFVVENLVNLILPSSKSIGAIDVQVPMFIDVVLKDVISPTEQNLVLKGGLVFKEKFEIIFGKDILNGKKSEFLTLLSNYFKLPLEKEKQVLELIKMKEEEVQNKELYYIYKYLTFIRSYTLFGYYNSKKVGTEILNYNPIPGTYEPCVLLSEVEFMSSI